MILELPLKPILRVADAEVCPDCNFAKAGSKFDPLTGQVTEAGLLCIAAPMVVQP
jgi:hypothetical protein